MSNRANDAHRSFALFVLLCCGLLLAFMASLLFGSTAADVQKAFSALVQRDFQSVDYRILFYIRLPRALAALLAGAALAVSGVLIQAVLNNPMAAPNLIGVNSGAGLAASLTIAFFPESVPLLPVTSFIGALAACLFIFSIASRTSASRLTITLVGIAVGSLLNACINTVKVLFPDSVYDADLFMIGGFSGMTYGKLPLASTVILFGLIFAFLCARDTDILCLGTTTAKSLGMKVSRMRFFLLMIASALAGAAVSFSGLLGFVGLLVPHIMRRFVGDRHHLLVPASALAGSLLVLLCDLVSRTLFAPYEIPVGIVLSLVGGIFFISMVLMGRRRDDA